MLARFIGDRIYLLFALLLLAGTSTGCPLDYAFGGLEVCDCDERPDLIINQCNVSHLRCRENAREWCKRDPDNPEACLTKMLSSCDQSHRKCLENIRRCPAGKTCSKTGKCE
jgi:hypothetical protein